MADKCEEYGLTLAEFSPETEARLKRALPVFASVKNPVDVTAQAVGDPDLFGDAIDICLKDANADVLVIYLGLLKGTGLKIARKIAEIANTTDKPLVVTWVAGPEDALQELKRNHVMTFGEPIRGIKSIGKLAGYHRFLQKVGRRDRPRTDAAPAPDPYAELKQWLRTIAEQRKFLSEHEARRVLQAFDIPVVEGDLSHSAEEAAQIAGQIGYPVVLKVNSPDIPHKSDVGGVMLNLKTRDEVVAAYDTIMERVHAALGTDIAIDGILVLKMEQYTAETLIGLKYDPRFGPAIAFGLGGIFVEVFKDVALRVAPLDRSEARDMLQDIRGKKILDGARGGEPADQDAIIDTILKISNLSLELKDYLSELDINPLFACPKGKGAKAGDALIVLK